MGSPRKGRRAGRVVAPASSPKVISSTTDCGAPVSLVVTEPVRFSDSVSISRTGSDSLPFSPRQPSTSTCDWGPKKGAFSGGRRLATSPPSSSRKAVPGVPSSPGCARTEARPVTRSCPFVASRTSAMKSRSGPSPRISARTAGRPLRPTRLANSPPASSSSCRSSRSTVVSLE